MRLILVRHGQTACNIGDIWHGWDDCALTELGQAQAQAVGRRLAAEPIAAIYSSDSRRAIQTARAVATPHGLDPIPEPALRERNPGTFEGLSMDEVLAAHPTYREERAADFWGWRPPQGETFAEVLERLLGVIERLEAEHGEETVVAVTHMSPVRVLVSHLLDVPIEDTYRMDFPSTGVSILRWEDGVPQVEALNDASHAASC
jgi:broad specificity phosphatase PhoE